jgi:ubiquinone/menaquinone biosynthesis C-methylase UbiE
MVTVRAGAALLDIGMGTGSLAALFEQRTAEITGIDVSRQMLSKCQDAHPNFQLEEGSFTEIPFADATFDIVVSSFTFHEVEPDHRVAACSEVARVVRPGGQLVILDIMFPSEAAVNEARHSIGPSWDPDEEYPLVGQLDTQLRRNGFTSLRWRQSGPYHWIVVARRQEAER